MKSKFTTKDLAAIMSLTRNYINILVREYSIPYSLERGIVNGVSVSQRIFSETSMVRLKNIHKKRLATTNDQKSAIMAKYAEERKGTKPYNYGAENPDHWTGKWDAPLCSKSNPCFACQIKAGVCKREKKSTCYRLAMSSSKPFIVPSQGERTVNHEIEMD